MKYKIELCIGCIQDYCIENMFSNFLALRQLKKKLDNFILVSIALRTLTLSILVCKTWYL